MDLLQYFGRHETEKPADVDISQRADDDDARSASTSFWKARIHGDFRKGELSPLPLGQEECCCELVGRRLAYVAVDVQKLGRLRHWLAYRVVHAVRCDWLAVV